MRLSNSELNGISFDDSSGATVQGNLISGSRGAGIDTLNSTGGHTIDNNTIRQQRHGQCRNPRHAALRHAAALVDRNRIYHNNGAGVLVTKDARQNIESPSNSIYDNGRQDPAVKSASICLSGGNEATGDAPYVTLNDPGDGDSGGNGLTQLPHPGERRHHSAATSF